MNRSPKRLHAMTLSEVLIMMIVSGIVFLSVMDGIRMFRNYMTGVAGRITENSDFYDSYYRLESLVTNADSVSYENDKMDIYNHGRLHATLSKQDSVIIGSMGGMRDTIMKDISVLNGIRNVYDGRMLDSVKITITQRDEGQLTLSFPVRIPKEVEVYRDAAGAEKKYRYE